MKEKQFKCKKIMKYPREMKIKEKMERSKHKYSNSAQLGKMKIK